MACRGTTRILGIKLPEGEKLDEFIASRLLDVRDARLCNYCDCVLESDQKCEKENCGQKDHDEADHVMGKAAKPKPWVKASAKEDDLDVILEDLKKKMDGAGLRLQLEQKGGEYVIRTIYGDVDNVGVFLIVDEQEVPDGHQWASADFATIAERAELFRKDAKTMGIVQPLKMFTIVP